MSKFFKSNKEIAEMAKKMKDYHGEDEVITSYEMKQVIDDMPEVKLLNTGFNVLDKHIEGFEGGNLIVISGPRKSGKTLFSQTLTHNFLKQGINALWLSYELTNKEFIRRFGGALPFFIMPKKMEMFSIDWVWSKVLESVQKQNVQIVFIDHLHYLVDISKIKNVSLEVGTIIRALKFLSIQTNTIIFLMCHTVKLDPTREPSDDNIRDSSFVSQESDVGIMIWRETEKPSRSWVKVCYSRRTGCFEQKIPFYKNYNTGLLQPEDDLF